MSHRRDLVAEMAARVSGGAIGAAQKKTRVTKAAGSADDSVEKLHSLEGKAYTDYTQAYVIQVTDELAEATLAKNDMDMATKLSEVQGVYWKIGHVGGLPVFRMSPDDGALFLWCSPHGWLVSRKLGTEPDEKGAVDADFVAWGAINKTDGFAGPTRLHVPYWQKKRCEGVVVLDYLQYMQENHPRGNAADEDVGDDAFKEVQVPYDDGDDGNNTKGDDIEAETTWYDCDYVKKHPTGWLNKIVRLLAAYLTEKWDICDALVEHYKTNPQVKKLTNDVMRKGDWAMNEPLNWKP